MKKLLTLLIVSTVVSSVTGCGCCRRLRDFVCRGSRCGGATALAVPPILSAPPMAAAPMAYDPGCNYAGYDPSCAYPGAQTYGYGSTPSYDSGWMPGGQACDSCSGGYSMPAYDGGYSDGGSYLADPGVSPGPAPIEGQ